MGQTPVVTEDGEILQRELAKTLNTFSSDVRFAIVYFNSQVWKFPKSGPPLLATSPNKSAAESFVRSMPAAPGSCPMQAIYDTLQFANRSTAKHNVIIYIADGWTDCPGYDPVQCAKEALQNVVKWNSKKIPIHVIVTGLEVQEEFPKKLAQLNGGTYRRVTR